MNSKRLLTEEGTSLAVVMLLMFTRYCCGLSVYDCVSGVDTEFREKLKDMTKKPGETALLTFSTVDSAPDLVHRFTNGTEVSLVISGRLNKQHVSPRYNISIITIQGAYYVSLRIDGVELEDAGTYYATDDNGLSESIQSFMELIVIGKHIISLS